MTNHTGYIAPSQEDLKLRGEASAYLKANRWKERSDTNWAGWEKEEDGLILHVGWHNRTVDNGCVTFLDCREQGHVEEFEIPTKDSAKVLEIAIMGNSIWEAIKGTI